MCIAIAATTGTITDSTTAPISREAVTISADTTSADTILGTVTFIRGDMDMAIGIMGEASASALATGAATTGGMADSRSISDGNLRIALRQTYVRMVLDVVRFSSARSLAVDGGVQATLAQHDDAADGLSASTAAINRAV